MIDFTCTHCDKAIRVADEHAGKRVRCPGCQEVVRVPDAFTAEPAEPTPRRPRRPADDDEGITRDRDRDQDAPRKSRSVREDAPSRSRRDDPPYLDEADEDEDRPRRRRRSIRRRSEWADCPNCGAADASKVSFTWWGGFLGPAIINTVRCNECGTSYNGIHGDYNTTRIVLYTVIPLAIVLPIAFVLGCLGIMR
jgi:hypothetical protein